MIVRDGFRTIARVLARAALAALTLSPLAAQSQTPPKYSATYLGTLVSSNDVDSVTAMSADGSKIVGWAYYWVGSKTGATAFYWDGTIHNAGVMTPLGGLPIAGAKPIGVNSSGTVLLGSQSPSVWTLVAGKVALPRFTLLFGGAETVAFAINDSGVVAGSSDDPNGLLGFTVEGYARYIHTALVWTKDTAGNWAYTRLPHLPGHNSSRTSNRTTAIDRNGNVIGTSYIASLDSGGNLTETDTHFVLWDNSLNVHDLGAIPGASHLPIDFRTDAASQTRFIWNSGNSALYSNSLSVTELLGSGAATPKAAVVGINALGQVAGSASFASGSHAAFWDPAFSSGTMMDLGVLSGGTSSQVASVCVNTIDDGGFIVGTSTGSTSTAFLSTPASRATSAKLLDLNTLLTTNALKTAGITTLTQGQIINNAGYIVCYGTDTKGGQRIVRLTRMQ